MTLLGRPRPISVLGVFGNVAGPEDRGVFTLRVSDERNPLRCTRLGSCGMTPLGRPRPISVLGVFSNAAAGPGIAMFSPFEFPTTAALCDAFVWDCVG